MTSCCMWTLRSSLPAKPCCPSVHRGVGVGGIQPDGIKLILDMNKSTIFVFTPRPDFTVQYLTVWWFLFRRLVSVIEDEYCFKPGQTPLLGETLSSHFSYSWHCCLLPSCLTRTRCNERLMLNSEKKMKLQGNKHEWVSGKAIWLRVSGGKQAEKQNPCSALFSSLQHKGYNLGSITEFAKMFLEPCNVFKKEQGKK